MTQGELPPRSLVPSTKLRPPSLPPDFIPRPRVHERLEEGRGRFLTIVCAPAGFGKTFALGGWLHEARRPYAWVSLHEHDSGLVDFIGLLIAALRTVVLNVGRQALAVAAQTAHPSPSELSALLVDDLAGVDDGLVIVLDDFHVIRAPAVHAFVWLLARHLPPKVQLVIAGREEPSIPLALLRQRHELAEIRTDDLRFDRAESIAFIRRMSDVPLDLRRVAEAVDRSEGWAVGLRLLTLGRSSLGPSQIAPMSAAAREHQVVDDYLFEEVLSRQSPNLQRFLTQTSIVDRFCAPLCEAVVDGLQPGDGRRLIDATMAAGLFLASLDDEQHWYRFHHLFRDMLLRRLERDAGSEHVRLLRRRASDWLADQGLWDEAATQAIDANDVGRVTSLVETCLMTHRSIGAGLMLEAWTRRLPDDVVETSPTLLLARCGRLNIRGEVGELGACLRRVEAMLAAEPSRMSPALLPIARGQIDMQLAWVLHQMGGGDHEALFRLERALELLPMDQYDHRGAAIGMYAITLQCLGRTDEALVWLRAEHERGTALHPDYVARLLVAQLYVELASGRLTAAADTGRRMVVEGNALQHPLVVGWGHFALARIAYEWNDLAGARDNFESILALGRDTHPLCSICATLGLALTLAAKRQFAEAERLVHAELEQAEEARNTFFVESLRSFMARLALASDDPDRAAQWLAGGSFTRQGTTAYDIEDQLLTRARVLVALATPRSLDEATAAVDRAIEAAEQRHVVASLVQGLALRALVEQSRGEMSRAAASITRALEIAAPGRFTRAFVDLGPQMTGLLVGLASNGGLPKGGQRVLDACRAHAGVPVPVEPSQQRGAPKVAVAMTWRELDVLQLMEAHLTADEIARLLGIPEEAVSQHARSIYRKLEVTGRQDAMLRAYDLGILRAEDRETPPFV